jgi:serine phosphatase RsbU (regulator of sigma subunit)
MGDSVRIASQWVGMGLIYHDLGNQAEALRYYFKAQKQIESSNNKDKISRLYMLISWSYQLLKEDSIALIYALKGLELKREINYFQGILSSLNTIKDLYSAENNYAKARQYNGMSMEESRKQNDLSGVSSCVFYFGLLHENQNNLDSALFYYNSALEIAIKVNNRGLLRDIYKQLSEALDKKGDTKHSYEYYKLYVGINDSLTKIETKNTADRVKEIYDVESKNQEIDLLNKDKELSEKDISTKKKTLFGLSFVLVIILGLSVIIFAGYRQKRKTAIDLSIQKKIIEEKNNDITDSILYAQRIQQAILPSIQQIKNALPDSFVFYSPKDIVSGDFFWFHESQDSFYLAAVDCTGHGVPGALMSMIGFNFLGQIVNEMNIDKTSSILNELHRKILNALNKEYSARDIKDGMDIGLLRIFKRTNKIQFSGAVRPLYLLKNGNLEITKGDIFSIGGIKDVDAESFSLHEFSLEKGTSIYLFSDGYADQFGGPKGKKFKYKQLQQLLVEVGNLSMDEQKNKVSETFKTWKGNLEQVDDVMVIGVKI